MALLPRLVGESRLGPANALLHTVQDLGVVRRPGDRARSSSPCTARRWRSSSTRSRSPCRRSHLDDAPTPGPPSDGRRRSVPPPSSGRASPRSAHAVSSCRSSIVVAMVELTYGAQTVQLVLYADQQLGLGAGGLRLPARRRRLRWAAERHGQRAAVDEQCSVSRIVVGTGGRCSVPRSSSTRRSSSSSSRCWSRSSAAPDWSPARSSPRRRSRASFRPTSLGRVMGVFDALSVAAMVVGAVLAPVLHQPDLAVARASWCSAPPP